MKQYIGTKTINAKPMTRAEYNAYREWELPSNENGDDKGYLVEYIDGGTANHPDHRGYISWSPKEVFEESYKVAETPLDRLVIEIGELDDRMKRLAHFLVDDKKATLMVGHEQALLLRRQLSCMENLSRILNDRITLMREEALSSKSEQ